MGDEWSCGLKFNPTGVRDRNTYLIGICNLPANNMVPKRRSPFVCALYIYTHAMHAHIQKNRELTCHNPPLYSPILKTLLLCSLCQTLEWGDVVEVCTLNYVGPNRYANCLIYPPILYNLLLDVYTLSIIFLTLSLI